MSYHRFCFGDCPFCRGELILLEAGLTDDGVLVYVFGCVTCERRMALELSVADLAQIFCPRHFRSRRSLEANSPTELTQEERCRLLREASFLQEGTAPVNFEEFSAADRAVLRQLHIKPDETSGE